MRPVFFFVSTIVFFITCTTSQLPIRDTCEYFVRGEKQFWTHTTISPVFLGVGPAPSSWFVDGRCIWYGSYSLSIRSQTVNVTFPSNCGTTNICVFLFARSFRAGSPTTYLDTYEAKVDFKDANGNIIHTFKKTALPILGDYTVFQLCLNDANTAKRVATIFISEKNIKDGEYWAGHYGCRIAAPRIYKYDANEGINWAKSLSESAVALCSAQGSNPRVLWNASVSLDLAHGGRPPTTQPPTAQGSPASNSAESDTANAGTQVEPLIVVVAITVPGLLGCICCCVCAWFVVKRISELQQASANQLGLLPPSASDAMQHEQQPLYSAPPNPGVSYLPDAPVVGRQTNTGADRDYYQYEEEDYGEYGSGVAGTPGDHYGWSDAHQTAQYEDDGNETGQNDHWNDSGRYEDDGNDTAQYEHEDDYYDDHNDSNWHEDYEDGDEETQETGLEHQRKPTDDMYKHDGAETKE